MTKGRPSKYDSKYCDLVIKMMSKGFSKQAVAGKLGISRDSLYEWCRKYPEFSDTIKIGEMKSYQFWEEIGMKMMLGKIKGKPSIWIFTMKNRFGWRDNVAIKSEEEKVEDIEREGKLEETPPALRDIVKKYSEIEQVFNKRIIS